MNSFVDIRHPERIYATEPLPAWTYLNAELLELEYERVILPSWQFVCHQNQVREVLSRSGNVFSDGTAARWPSSWYDQA